MQQLKYAQLQLAKELYSLSERRKARDWQKRRDDAAVTQAPRTFQAFRDPRVSSVNTTLDESELGESAANGDAACKGENTTSFEFWCLMRQRQPAAVATLL
jgi:hypothetical protein